VVVAAVVAKGEKPIKDECQSFLISVLLDSSFVIVVSVLLSAVCNHYFSKMKRYRMVQGNYIKHSGRIDLEAYVGQTILWNIIVVVVC
jgi:hypothetical protein